MTDGFLLKILPIFYPLIRLFKIAQKTPCLPHPPKSIA